MFFFFLIRFRASKEAKSNCNTIKITVLNIQIKVYVDKIPLKNAIFHGLPAKNELESEQFQ